MLIFHNDHLVAPEFCKLMYDTVDPTWDLNVVFIANTPKFRKRRSYTIRGRCNSGKRRVLIFLQGIFYGCKSEFEIWMQLLKTSYHEFGHYANRRGFANLSQSEYDKLGRGYWACEDAADEWADRKILELADHDKRLAQPKRLGPYIDGRWLKRNLTILSFRTSDDPPDWRLLKNYRCHVSGGQLSIGDVAHKIGAYVSLGQPRYKVIHKIADDLGYPYLDSAGRLHMFYAWGDVPEIKRRYERYKAIHGEPDVREDYLPF